MAVYEQCIEILSLWRAIRGVRSGQAVREERVGQHSRVPKSSPTIRRAVGGGDPDRTMSSFTCESQAIVRSVAPLLRQRRSISTSMAHASRLGVSAGRRPRIVVDVTHRVRLVRWRSSGLSGCYWAPLSDEVWLFFLAVDSFGRLQGVSTFGLCAIVVVAFTQQDANIQDPPEEK